MNTPETPLPMSLREAAKATGIEVNDVYALAKYRAIPVSKIGGRMVLTPDTVEALRQLRQDVTA